MFNDVEVAEFHPCLSVVHELFEVSVELGDGADIVALSHMDRHFAFAGLKKKSPILVTHSFFGHP